MIPKWREIGLLVSYPSSEGYKAQASKHGTATLPVSCVDELYERQPDNSRSSSRSQGASCLDLASDLHYAFRASHFVVKAVFRHFSRV